MCAIPEELAQLHSDVNIVNEFTLGGATYTEGHLEEKPIVLVGAGIGKVNTAISSTLLINRFGCRAVIFSGVAGGLDPQLNVGDIVISRTNIQHDAGVLSDERIDTYQAGHVPFFNPTNDLGYPVGDNIIRALELIVQDLRLPPLSPAAGGTGDPPRIVFGNILSGDQFLSCEATRRRLNDQFDGHAVEMEGGALGQVCASFDIPYLNIRAISDKAGQHAEFDFTAFVKEVAPNAAILLKNVIKVL